MPSYEITIPASEFKDDDFMSRIELHVRDPEGNLHVVRKGDKLFEMAINGATIELIKK